MHARLRAAAAALAAAALAASLAVPAAADDDLKKKVEELEKRLREVEGRREAAPADRDLDAAIERYLKTHRGEGAGREGDPSYLLGGVSRPSSKDYHIGGYATFLYRSPDDRDSIPAFEGYRVVPQLAFDVSPGIEFATEIEFEGGGAGLAYLTGNYIVIEYAELRFDVDESFVPKTGILLIPFLRYNLAHDDPIWNLQDRPVTATRVFRAAFQQPGVGVEGVLPAGNGHSFNYNVALTNGIKDGVDNSGFSNSRTSFRTDNNHDKAFWGRFGVTPRLPWVDAADFGVSFARAGMADQALPSVNMMGWGVDGKVTKGRFDFFFEWANFHYDRPASQDPATFPHQTSGGFVQLDTRLIRGFPKTKSGILGKDSELILAVRAETVDTNERVTGAHISDDCEILVMGLALRFTQKTVLRIERRWENTRFEAPGGREQKGMWVASISTYF